MFYDFKTMLYAFRTVDCVLGCVHISNSSSFLDILLVNYPENIVSIQTLEIRRIATPLSASFLDKIHDFTESVTRFPILSPRVSIGDSPITA